MTGRYLPALLASLILAASPVSAETVRVRSGEHPGFSRLVAEFRALPNWSIVRDGPDHLIRAEPRPTGYDVTGVFDMIPRTRIADLARDSETGDLRIRTACDCAVTVSVVRDRYLVIDVADVPGTPTAAPAAQPAEAVQTADVAGGADDLPITRIVPLAGDGGHDGEGAPPEPLQPPWPLTPSSGLRTPSDGGYRTRDDAARSTPDLVTIRPDPMPGHGLAEDATPSVEAPAQGAASVPDALSEHLARGIARAATQGLLDVERAVPDVAGAATGTAETDAGADLPNLLIRVPGERRAPEIAVSTPDDVRVPFCVADDRLDLSGWYGPRQDDYSGLGQYRAGVSLEFDRVDTDRAVALARHYLAIGFGAEAASVVRALVPGHTEASLIVELGDVIDDRAGAAFPILGNQAGCPGRAALWYLLVAGDREARIEVEDATASLAAFAELPLSLRRHLGPRLVDRYLEGGSPSAAELVRRLIARAPGPHGTEFEMMDARLRAETSDDAGGLEDLEMLAEGGSHVAPEAMVALLRLSLERGEIPDLDAVDAARAQAYELRGSQAGRDLADVLVRALIARGDFADAYDLLWGDRLERRFDPADAIALRDTFLLSLTAGAADGDFLRLGTSVIARPGTGDLDAEATARVASRFLDLGLPEVALRYLDLPGGPVPEAHLAARLALAAGDPRAALASLERTTDAEADRLRGEALDRLGRHGEAAEAFARAGDAVRSEAQIWKTGDWERIAETDAGILSEAAALMAGALPSTATAGDPSEPATAAARAEAAVTRSASSRTIVEALFSTVPGP